MSHPHDIDSEDHLFRFDTYEEQPLKLFPSATSQSASLLDYDARDMSAHGAPSTSEELDEREESSSSTPGKGKGVTKPMPIRSSMTVAHDSFDPTTLHMISPASRISHLPPLLPPLTSSPFHTYSSPRNDALNTFSLFAAPDVTHTGDSRDPVAGVNTGSTIEKWKGKEKELPPTLPPLTFSPTEFGYGQTAWPSSSFVSSTPGPSSYGSNCGLSTMCSNTNTETGNLDTESSTFSPNPATSTQAVLPTLKRMPSRRRSLSNLSVRSTRSLAARSMSRIKLRFSSPRSPSNLAHKLLFRKTLDTTEVPSFTTGELDTNNAGGHGTDSSNMFTHWPTEFKVDELDSSISQLSYLRLLDIPKSSNAFYYRTSSLKHKGRSNSSPFPLSPLDFVPMVSTDIFTPIPLVIKNYFDEILPKELRLHILASLIALHEAEHLRAVREGRWTMAKASSSRGRWIGRDKGIRELVRMSRVSKSWQVLVFDGQLWANLDLHTFPNMPESLLLRLTETGGAFTIGLDVAGHVQISSATFIDMADKLCLNTVSSSIAPPSTQLTTANLQGCSGLSSRSLHYFLVRSHALRTLCLKGLRAVTNTTCDIISTYCPQLVALDLGRCPNMDAEGIRSLGSAAIVRGEHLALKELRICGLKNVSDTMMSVLGKAAPHLEVLDLSYSRQLHNSAVEAFIACEEEGEYLETILVSPRDVGRESNDSGKFRRRLTRLRHLSLSSCILLTDDACSNLAHSVPKLEFLELAGIGADLQDEGLIRLLNTTPLIRRLDLEDASDISDAVIAILTPSTGVTPAPNAGLVPEPGQLLEQINISYATRVSDDALLGLIRGCTRLKWLESDNTRIGAAVIREFVRLARERKMVDAKVVATDCRGMSEPFVREISTSTRPRKGWRAHSARKLMYLDERDDNTDELKVGQDECDEMRVVFKSFYSWQTVDAVKSVREKRRKSTSRRAGNESGSTTSDQDLGDLSRSARWWSPGGRRSPQSGRSSPLNMADLNGDGCRLM